MSLAYGSSKEKLSVSIRKCCYIIESYSWLTDAYILDFFTEDLWKRLPCSWQDVLNNAEFSELGSWLDYTQVPRYQRPWPLSLLALRVAVESISLPRRVCHPMSNDKATRNIDITCRGRGESSHGGNSLLTFTDCSLQKKVACSCGHVLQSYKGGSKWTRLQNAFQKHVSPKKRHEIFRMAEVVCQWAMDMDISHIVDVGSGIGHLARLLSYGHGLSVCCIEAQETLSSKARKLDEEVEKTLSKILTEEQLMLLPRPFHITSCIGPGLGRSDFVQLVSQAFQEVKCLHGVCPSSNGFGIVGLHPCGDLAPYLMRMFVDCPEARFLCIAGCCYMKLTPDIGFPMSARVMSNDAESPWQRGFQLSYEAREMACHAIESYSRNLLSGNTSSLKIHCYRATLENIIAKNWPKLRRTGLKSIKYDEQLQFPEYARRALSALNLVPPEKDILSSETNECLNSWRQVVCFYSLRLIFAPLVESLILIDRFLFLSLKGVRCRISPEFDPELSPRNHLLIASRPAST